MKQIGLAVMLYAGDNEDSFPMDTHTGGNRFGWRISIQPYSKGKAVFRCPSDPSANFDRPLANSLVKRESSYGTNFYMNPAVTFEGEDPPTSFGWNNLSAITSVSSTVYIAEIAKNSPSDHFHPPYWYSDNPDFIFYQPEEEVNETLHQGQANYLFADGHVKRRKFDSLFSGDRKTDFFDPRREPQ